VHEDVGYGLTAFSAFGQLAGVPTPVIDAQIMLTTAATGIDYFATGLSLAGMGLAGVTRETLLQRVHEGL
jgi:hypothetical protein